jgi:hypothetical protein
MTLTLKLDSGIALPCAACDHFPVIAPWYSGGERARRIWCDNPQCPERYKVEATTAAAALVKWNELNETENS